MRVSSLAAALVVGPLLLAACAGSYGDKASGPYKACGQSIPMPGGLPVVNLAHSTTIRQTAIVVLVGNCSLGATVTGSPGAPTAVFTSSIRTTDGRYNANRGAGLEPNRRVLDDDHLHRAGGIPPARPHIRRSLNTNDSQYPVMPQSVRVRWDTQ
jgi:hypothetical protein